MVRGLLSKIFSIILRRKYSRKFLLGLMPKNSVCAEIGVYEGDFSKKILSIVNPKKLHLIDPWKYEEGESYKDALYGGAAGSQEVMDDKYRSVVGRFKPAIKKGRVLIHRKSSEDASKDFQDNYFDWIYIDGNHLYEFVKKDLELYFKKVKRGGFITGDDYIKGGWWEGGVKKAVDEFLEKGLAEKIKIKNGNFILRKH